MFSNNAVKGHLEQYNGGITIENSAQVGIGSRRLLLYT